MKVRLTKDMIRVRVDQPDVDRLAASGTVAFALPLGDDRALRCVLEIRDGTREVEAQCTEREIRVLLPRDRAEEWMTTDAIGLEGRIATDDGPTRILVEKDVGCRHGDDASASANTSTFDHLRDSAGRGAEAPANG